ncbi:hypothetical protein IU459_11760 [Nocardia amamiensis]|uniref:Uncharacterized protein n=1 Tax=Nocardia amamiensis TaxID=404578 RepID=A0ABS0CNM1_9NOCA|nr:hypothetical protein [Nocardia amamiensis]MBF6298216.1 hypothetical protein [Nocardia amamiensis]
MEQVTARAEQRFGVWSLHEVRTIDRTPYVDALIRDGRLTVVETTDPGKPWVPYEDTPTPEPEQTESDPPEASAAQAAPTERGRRRRPPSGQG